MELDYYKSSNWHKTQIYSMMTNSDLAEIMIDKHSEIDTINTERYKLKKWTRWDSRKIIDSLYDWYVKEVEKVINSFKYELNLRNPAADSHDIMEKLENAKRNSNIVDLIESLGWMQLRKWRQLNKCPLKDHNEKTWSFNVYEKTNSWYCFWCKRWGDWINFIELLTWCSRAEAIKSFISLNK